MKAVDFDYVRARTLEEALSLLAANEDSRVLAGGQSLAPALNLRLATPALLVDIGGLRAELARIEPHGDGLRIGALARHAEIARSDLVRARCPLLADAIAHVAHPAIRNRGTLGGSLANADPAAELPACMLALDATIVVVGRAGERRIPAHAFFLGVYETALGSGEVLTAVEIPYLAPARRFGFAELSRRRGDFAVVGLAAAATAGGAGLVGVRLAFFGVADRPVLASRCAAAIEGGGGLEAARAALADDLQPHDDAQASGAMRLQLAGVVLEQALRALETGSAT